MSLSLTPTILAESNNLKDFPSYYPVTESYLYSTLNFIHETNNMYKSDCIALYEAIAISDTDEAIEEAYTDFYNKAMERIKKAIAFILNKINQFIHYLSKYITDDKLLQDRKDFVIKSFIKNGLSFKCEELYIGNDALFNKDVPVMNNIFTMEDSNRTKQWVSVLMNNYGSAKEEDIKHAKEELNNFLVDEADKTDNVRGIIVGKNNEHITAQEYPKFLRDLFIGQKELNVKIDASYLTDLFTELSDYHALLNDFKAKKKSIDKVYNDVLTDLKNSPFYIVKSKGEARVRDFAEEFQRRMASVATERINAHMMALSIKMDCIKQMYRQDRSLIMKAISVAATKKSSNSDNAISGDNTEVVAASADLLMDEKFVMSESEFDYMTTMFFIDEMASQSGMVVDVKEILTEAGVTMPIQEAVSLKDILDNLVSTIANMYTVFITWFEKISGTNTKFLKDNKNVIISNPFKDETINNTYPYKIDDIKSTGIPALYYEQIKETLDTKEAFIKAEFNDYAKDYEEGSSFRDIVKTALCGSAEKQSVKTSELPSVAQMYEFCAAFSGGEGAYASIKKDIRTLNNSNKEMARIIQAAQPKPTTATGESFVYEAKLSAEDRAKLKDSDFGLPSKKKFPMPDAAHVSNAITRFNTVDSEDEAELAKNIIKKIRKFKMKDIDVSPKNRFSKYYKAVNEAEIGGTEGSDNKAADSGSSSGDTSSTTNQSTSSNASSQENVDAMDKSRDAVKADAAEDIKKTTTRIKNYFGVCGDYLAAKFTVARWAYVDYMKILKWHVGQYAPKAEEGGESKPEAKGEEANKSNSEPIDIENPEKK